MHDHALICISATFVACSFINLWRTEQSQAPGSIYSAPSTHNFITQHGSVLEFTAALYMPWMICGCTKKKKEKERERIRKESVFGWKPCTRSTCGAYYMQ